MKLVERKRKGSDNSPSQLKQPVNREAKGPPRGDETASETAGASSEASEKCEPNLLQLDLTVAGTLSEWSDQVKEVFKTGCTFGRHMVDLVKTLPTPLGNFVRSCCAAQPPTSGGGGATTHGDLLPIPPWGIDTGIVGITPANVEWVRLVVYTLNFHYTALMCPACERDL